MRVPYIKVKQKSEEFFVVKFKANDLRERVNFHFREPYMNTKKEVIDYKEYIEKLRRKGIDINAEHDGVQRRVQMNRIQKIKGYLEGQNDSYFPNSVVLAADLSEEDSFLSNFFEKEEVPDFGQMDLPDDITFEIVDGQHRLAGLFVSDESIQKNFEIFAVILFNATRHTCAKIFRDINGNQAPVNKSGLFDLLELMETDEIEMLKEKNVHTMCKNFNEDRDSPLYCHIKMMGIGSGAISQAFFVQTVKKAFDDIGVDISKEENVTQAYYSLFYYFSAFQRVFPYEWPVLGEKQFQAKFVEDSFIDIVKAKELYAFDDIREEYSRYVLREKKSQLLKTNGFGAMLKLFPKVYNICGKEAQFGDYMQVIGRLSEKVDWCTDEVLTSGTGVKIINKVYEKLVQIIMS